MYSRGGAMETALAICDQDIHRISSHATVGFVVTATSLVESLTKVDN